MTPLNLTQRPPRSPYVERANLLMLARTIDKMRAELPGGHQGEYHYGGFSEQLLTELGIDHDTMLSVIATAPDEASVIAWVTEHSDTTRYPEINAQFLARCIDETNRERLTIKYPVIKEHSTVSRLFDVLDLDDRAFFGDELVEQIGRQA